MRAVARYGIAIAATLALLAAGVAAFVYSGVYDIGADDPHTASVHAMLETMRDRSIHARAESVDVPEDLGDPARIRQGAGNYDAMCKGCHLAPGMGPTELSEGLYPAPPNLSRHAVDAAEAFWVIDHGIKASGMPAWGASMDDPYIWNMVAFLQLLPSLSPAEYAAQVAASGGHDHGGGETDLAEPGTDDTITHRHADGTFESHPVPQPETHDDHDHPH